MVKFSIREVEIELNYHRLLDLLSQSLVYYEDTVTLLQLH